MTAPEVDCSTPIEPAVPMYAFLITAGAITGLLFLRSIYIQYPIILADEAYYTLHSKFLGNPRFVPTLPNLLYFWVYHPAARFGINHAAFEKLLNAMFFGLSLFPLHAVARRFISSKGAYVFALAVILSPISSFSVYVMPESMYFFVFWGLTYIVIVRLPKDIVYGGLYAGLVLAALSAVKPHGLVLIPVIPAVMMVIYFESAGLSLLKVLEGVAIFLVAIVIGRLAINYLAHGDFAITLVGSYYGGYFGPSSTMPHRLVSPELLYSLRGHLSYLMILLWPAILVALWPTERAGPVPRRLEFVALLVFSFLTVMILIVMTSRFTVEINQLPRLHGRYYDFALPTLILLFLARTGSDSRAPRWPLLFKIVAIGGSIAAAAALYFYTPRYSLYASDFPDVIWIHDSAIHLGVVMVWGIGAAACLALSSRPVARLSYCALLALVALLGSRAVYLDHQVMFVAVPPVPDSVAIAVRNLVPSQIDDGIVISRVDDGRTYRALFELYSLSEQKIVDKLILSESDIPRGKKWALLLDPYILQVHYRIALRGRGFQFIEFAPDGIGLLGKKFTSP